MGPEDVPDVHGEIGSDGGSQLCDRAARDDWRHRAVPDGARSRVISAVTAKRHESGRCQGFWVDLACAVASGRAGHLPRLALRTEGGNVRTARPDAFDEPSRLASELEPFSIRVRPARERVVVVAR